MNVHDHLWLLVRWYYRTVTSQSGVTYWPVFGYDGQVEAYGTKQDFWRTWSALRDTE